MSIYYGDYWSFSMRVSTLTILARRLAGHRRLRLGLAVLLGLFIASNAVLFVIYKNRTYPNTVVGNQQLGSVPAGQLQAKLRAMPLLPKQVTFKQNQTAAKVDTSQLGVVVDYRQLAAKTLSQRSWLPMANLWQDHNVSLSFSQNQSTLQKALSASLAAFQKAPGNARITRQTDSFTIQPESSGQKVDLVATSQRLLAALGQSNSSVPVVTSSVAAAITGLSLQDELSSLNKQSRTAITLQYNGQTKRLTAAEVTALYSPDAAYMTISDAAILTTVNNSGAAWGIVVDNRQAAVATIKAALQDNKDTTVTLVAAPKILKTIRYCTALRGVSESALPELDAKVHATLNDSRGWSISGLVRFEKSDANCEMRVWLSAADQMPSFGAICDSQWSCAVHPNVVINYDRWTQTSAAWQAAGGSREDYRAMVINHESGHWFGFYHSNCGGAGQPAPVMQQQSINLQGCTFNPWPTTGEQASLKQRLGL